jgi:ribonuclease HI
VRNRKVKTNLVRNAKTETLWQLIERGEEWLKNNTWQNPILKWDTDSWGEIPADFGRK